MSNIRKKTEMSKVFTSYGLDHKEDGRNLPQDLKTRVQHLPLPFTLRIAYVSWSGGEGHLFKHTREISALTETFPSTEDRLHKWIAVSYLLLNPQRLEHILHRRCSVNIC